MSNVSVELCAFSGIPNPTFTLDDDEAADLAGRVTSAMAAGGESPAPEQKSQLDYSGFVVSADGEFGLPAQVSVFAGRVTVVTEAQSTEYPDTSGSEGLLLTAARRHGLGEMLDALGLDSIV